LLRETYRRAAGIAGPEGVYLSARSAHRDLIRQELPELSDLRLILEPVRRNTAPAVALAALLAEAEDPDAVLVVLPSDQAVRDEELFQARLAIALQAARTHDAFVTLGIPPTRPETGFGYLLTAPEADGRDGPLVRRVIRFVEKPSLERAREYVEAGTYLWNAGIFLFRVGLLIRELERQRPDVLAAARRAAAASRAHDSTAFEIAFRESPAVSLDHAVMEKAPEVLTVLCACGWSDLGSWESVYEFRGGHAGKNVLEGPARCVEATGDLVLASGRPILVIGVSDIIVVDSPDGILVMRHDASDALRASVEETLAGVESKIVGTTSA
jgi:mannose-1-phosphate guanylyltransferase/mannose-6-phosphate isomerase